MSAVWLSYCYHCFQSLGDEQLFFATLLYHEFSALEPADHGLEMSGTVSQNQSSFELCVRYFIPETEN